MEQEISTQFFLSTISHELRTPLNGIIGYSNLLTNTNLNRDQELYVDSIKSCSLQLIEVVNDIRDYNLLILGKLKPKIELFQIGEILKELDEIVGYKLKEKKQSLKYIIANKDQYILSDKHRLLQILVNLTTNAIKFSERSKLILISIEYTENGILNISIEDSGVGIREADKSKVFQPFFRASEEKEGTGLGLSISKLLAKLLKGDITFESQYGVGSTFNIQIQCENQEKYDMLIRSHVQLLQDCYILIIENNTDERINLVESLDDAGLRPIACATIKEANKLLIRKKYDFIAIICDISLGIDVIKKLETKIPKIGIFEDRIYNDGFYKILKKPVEKTLLLETIYDVSGKSEPTPLNDDSVKEMKKSYNFLIVEDNPYNSDILNRILNSLGYNNIDIAKDGFEAIDMFEKKSYDIMFLDLKLPKLDGIDVARYVKSKNCAVKITVLTASISENDKDVCKELGIKYFILKPFDISHIKIIIKKLLFGTIKINS